MPQSKYVWYCCQCSYGPLSWEVDAGCPNCLNLRCSNCEIVGRGPSRVAQAGNSINPSQEASRYSVADTNKPVGLEDSWAASRESAQFRAPHLGDVKTIKDGDGSSSTAPAESAQVQNPEDPAAVDESMQFLEDLDINYLDDFFAERDVASQIARALLSDVGLRQSITHGFEENAEHFPEQLIICTRFLAIELQDYATQEHEQRAAVFIAKHALTIVRKIKSELGMTDPGGYAMLDDDEAFPLHGEYLNIVLSGGPFFWNSSQNNIVLQSNLEAVQLFILQPPSPHNFIVRLQKYLDDPHHNETLMPVNQQDKISMRSLFVETFPRIKRVMEPKPQPGTIRIRWTCSCGTMVWDDYPQRPACEANLLQLRLNRLFRTATNDNSTTQHTNTAFHPWRTPRTLMINLRVLLGGLYRENEQQRDPENTTPSPPHHLEEDAGVYLLTCVGTGRGLSSLFQEKWNSVKNDRTYFQMLRTLNSTSTSGWRNFFKFQTITAIEYVRFHPLGKQLVDVCSDIPAFPPDDRAGQYEPCESLLQKGSPLEAWRSNALLHLYHKAHNITTIRRVLRRIPRKLNGALLVGQDDADMGWAMYRRSGLDRERILWTCFMALVLCMVPGLSWWMLRDDVQGGTGITSCLMVFVCFFVAATTTGKP